MPLNTAVAYPADESAVTCSSDYATLEKDGLYEIHYAVSCDNHQANASVALEINGKIKGTTLRKIENGQNGVDHTTIYQAAKGDKVRLVFDAPCAIPQMWSELYIKYYKVSEC
ncbi:MAG: hypothetical protein ACI4MB_06555 [Candidatus Coproplasma sp.]